MRPKLRVPTSPQRSNATQAFQRPDVFPRMTFRRPCNGARIAVAKIPWVLGASPGWYFSLQCSEHRANMHKFFNANVLMTEPQYDSKVGGEHVG